MNMNNSRYSVLMSVYYKENPEYLRESIISMLQQTVMPDEIILVKDGPLTKELENVIDEFKYNDILKIIELDENVGLGKALNIGLKACKNELVARMDTDDVSREDRCEKQLERFKNNKSLSILSSTVAEFDTDINNINNMKRLPTKHEEIIKYSKKRNPFNHPSVMYRKEAVQKAGGYQHFHLFEDYYMWVRMILSGAVCENIDEPLLFMRANEDMFRRRGGASYFKSVFKFKFHILRLGFLTFPEFIISIIIRGFVSLVPNKMRIMMYKRFLRK